MSWLVAHIKLVMQVSGGLTCTMLYCAVAPAAAFRSTFGEPLEGAAAEIVVRNWGILIFLVGIGLIYGAYLPPSRRLILSIAAAGKIAFIGLVLSHGSRYLAYQAGVAVVFDLAMVALFVAYLL